jgi:hypothetical protein
MRLAVGVLSDVDADERQKRTRVETLKGERVET